MADPDDEDRAMIRELYAGSKERLLDRVAAVEAAVAELAGGTLDGPGRGAGVEEAHKLAGSLGTFGVPGGSDLAKELELLLDGDAGPDQATRATELAAALRGVVEAGPR